MKRTTMILVGCIAAAGGGYTTLAQNAPTNPRVAGEADGQKTQRDQNNARARTPQARHLAHASEVMDMTVRDPQGKEIGEVEDLIIDSQGRVAFVIVSFEDSFVSDDQFYAVPPKALRPGSDPDRQDLILSTSKETFTANSGFSSERFPKFDEQNTRDTYKRFDQSPYWEGDMHGRTRDQANPNDNASKPGQDRDKDAREKQQDDRDDSAAATGQNSHEDRQRAFNMAPQFDHRYGWTTRASEVIGKPVVNDRNESLGSIKDLVFDVNQCRVLYAVLTDGGVLNLNETFTPIPYAALTATGDKDLFVLDATKGSFEVISFKESAWPDMGNRQWAQRVHTQFKQDSYWAVEANDGAQSANVDKSWRHDSTYNKSYDAKRPVTVTGTVTSISEFSPEDGAAKGRQLMLRSEDGKTTTVHMGPTSYMQQQDESFAIKQGDALTVTGAACTFQDNDVLIASKIHNKDGKSLELRDKTGSPKWDNRDRTNDRETDRPEATERDNANPTRP